MFHWKRWQLIKRASAWKYICKCCSGFEKHVNISCIQSQTCENSSLLIKWDTKRHSINKTKQNLKTLNLQCISCSAASLSHLRCMDLWIGSQSLLHFCSPGCSCSGEESLYQICLRWNVLITINHHYKSIKLQALYGIAVNWTLLFDVLFSTNS